MLSEAERRVLKRTAWRIEGTLREFEKFAPVNLWFDYPVHVPDANDLLKLAEASGETPSWKQNFGQKKSDEERKQEKNRALETAFEMCKTEESVNGKSVSQSTIKDLAEYLGLSEKTVKRRVNEHSGFWISDGKVGKK